MVFHKHVGMHFKDWELEDMPLITALNNKIVEL